MVFCHAALEDMCFAITSRHPSIPKNLLADETAWPLLESVAGEIQKVSVQAEIGPAHQKIRAGQAEQSSLLNAI
eukprot:1145913-Pelagomonas_calceolata.AAC.4